MNSPSDTAVPEAFQIPVALSPLGVKENLLVQFAVSRAGSLANSQSQLEPWHLRGDLCAPWQNSGLDYSLFQLQQKLLHF